MTYKKAVARREQLLIAPDSPDQNGSQRSERKKSRTSARERESSGQGGIDRFFGRKGGNGVLGDEASAHGDRMDIDK